MKNLRKRGVARGTAALLILLLLTLSFASCTVSPSSTTAGTTAAQTTAGTTEPAILPTADELKETFLALAETDAAYSSVNGWLKAIHFPAYDVAALQRMELYYESYFIREVPAPKALTGELIEYFTANMDGVDLTDSDAVTDLLLTCYLAAAGDKYAYYMNAEALADYLSDLEGNFVGIGVQVVYDSIAKTIEIVSVLKGTPAEAAGILPGDFLVAVDGTEITELSYYDIIDRIRGEIGTPVSVTVLRGEERLTYTMTRAALTQVTVEGQKPESAPQIGYVRISEFDETTFPQFRDTVTELLDGGAKALIFDVRENPGGLLTAILNVLDWLVEDGVPLASYVYYDGSTETATASDGHAFSAEIPIAVLANGHTASAGELFTSALKDYGEQNLLDVTVIGTVTYGKGTMQTMLSLPGDRATTVSIAYYNPPYSGNYEEIGVSPDLEIHLSEEAAKKSLYLLTLEEDTQLCTAIATLTEKLGQ